MASPSLTYGSTLNLKSAVPDVGFLSRYGTVPGLPELTGWVATAALDPSADYHESSRWEIVAVDANGKDVKNYGQPILVGDAVQFCFLESVSPGNASPTGGYLDSYGWAQWDQVLSKVNSSSHGKAQCGVFTSQSPNRDPAGSGKWTILKDGAKTGDPVYEYDKLSFMNVYSQGKAGALVAYGDSYPMPSKLAGLTGNLTSVFTSLSSDLVANQKWQVILSTRAVG